MGDISSDTLSQLEMLRDAYINLREKDPNHELLSLAELHEDGLGFNFTPEYAKKCVRDGEQKKIKGYTRYTSALRDAFYGASVKLLDTDPPCGF